MNQGKLYGVGMGPGDPELLTIKARRIIQACPVLAVPRRRRGEKTALAIAGELAAGEAAALLRRPHDKGQRRPGRRL